MLVKTRCNGVGALAFIVIAVLCIPALAFRLVLDSASVFAVPNLFESTVPPGPELLSASQVLAVPGIVVAVLFLIRIEFRLVPDCFFDSIRIIVSIFV